MNFKGLSYDEIKEQVKQDLEIQKAIALPGGTWCWFCSEEICVNSTHGNRIRLHIVIKKLMEDLEEERMKK
jgi:hypothetical protein